MGICFRSEYLTMALGVAISLRAGAAAGAGSIPRADVFVRCSAETLATLEAALGVDGIAMRWLSVAQIDPRQIVQPPPERGRPVRAWIDCAGGDGVRIIFSNWETRRFLVRDIALRNGWDELARESLAQVIGSSITALATDQEAGLSLTEMTSILRPPAPAAPRPRWSAALGAFYSLQAFSRAQPVAQGVGLAAVVAAPTQPWSPGAWLSAQIQFPETIGTGLIGARLDTAAIRGGARLARSVAGPLTLSLLLGGGVDAVHIAAREGSTVRASLSPDRVSWRYDAELALAAAVRLGTWTELWGTLLADADIGARHYDVVVDGATVHVLSPWWFRPGVAVGVAWP